MPQPKKNRAHLYIYPTGAFETYLTLARTRYRHRKILITYANIGWQVWHSKRTPTDWYIPYPPGETDMILHVPSMLRNRHEHTSQFMIRKFELTKHVGRHISYNIASHTFIGTRNPFKFKFGRKNNMRNWAQARCIDTLRLNGRYIFH